MSHHKSHKIKDLPEKSHFEKLIDKKIEEYLDTLPLESYHHLTSQLKTPQMERLQKKAEIEEASKCTLLNDQLTKAIQIVRQEGKKYLSLQNYISLWGEFSLAIHTLEKLKFDEVPSENFQQLLNISQSSMESLEYIANELYSSKHYEDALSVSCLLLVLAPEKSDYWYRVALSAQQAGDLNFALKAYSSTTNLDPNHVGAKVFPIECYLLLGNIEEAKIAFDEAEKTIHNNSSDTRWNELLADFKKWLQEH